MFGYVRINKEELRIREYKEYQGYYCGLCHALGTEYGLRSRFTLSYDTLFLALLLTSLYEPPLEKQDFRCPLHPLKKRVIFQNSCVFYSAGVNLLLSYYKVLDDVQDEGSLQAKASLRLLEKPKAKACAQYPSQAKAISTQLKELRRLEQEGSTDLDALSSAFGHLLGAAFRWKDDVFSASLYSIGFNLGKYIYLVDAWRDLEEDRKKNRFNPFSHEEDLETAGRRLKTQLCFILSCVTENMNRLPLLLHRGILDNILYSGITAPIQTIFAAPDRAPEKEELFLWK